MFTYIYIYNISYEYSLGQVLIIEVLGLSGNVLQERAGRSELSSEELFHIKLGSEVGG